MRAWTWTTLFVLFLFGGCDNDGGGDEVNHCDPDPCVNGVCTDGADDYSCACDPGFEGVDCDVPVAECGDGTILAPEVCDGSDLDSQTCLALGFSGGSLACAADCLSVDTTACTNTTVPPDWTCDESDYDDGAGCDCDCGAYDIDCDDPSQTILNCLPGETCSASGLCEGDSACSQVSVDQYEENDTCELASPLTVAAQDAPAIIVSDPTLHHPDQTLDTDWYSILATEGSLTCLPMSSQCYFIFDIAFTPPDPTVHATYEMCVTQGACTGTPICTTGAHWNATALRYELSISWEGTCGVSDDAQFYVQIARNGGQESCDPYTLEYQMSYTDESCP
ncbi:MAG: calcium-binding EGF-like domain-containing protein [Deltaproteobacteria bacterium]|nr:calcium-binding EGF-like domain-containing protein [Deltaproteobacteria bacterium]